MTAGRASGAGADGVGAEHMRVRAQRKDDPLRLLATHPDRPGRSLKVRLYTIVGFLGVIPMLGAVLALIMVANAARDSAALDRTARGSIHLERIKGLINAVVMESRGIEMAGNWKAAEPSAHSLTEDLIELQDVADAWKSEAIDSQRSNIDELVDRVGEFTRIRTDRFHTELARLNGPDPGQPAQATDESGQDRRVRAALSDTLGTVAHAYEWEIGKARQRVEDDNRYLIIALLLLAGVAVIALCAGLLLIRGHLLAPLLRVKKSMLRLAEGDLESRDHVSRQTAEIAEMDQAIGVFRDGMVERARLNREGKLLSELNEWLQSCNSLQELYQMVAQFLSRLMPNCGGSLYVYSNSRDILECAKSWNGSKVSANMRPEDCWGLRRGRVYTFGEKEIDFACTHIADPNHGEYCCIPILAHGDTIGLLNLDFHCEGDKCSIEEVGEFRRLGLVCAEQISLAIANVKLRDQLRDQSIRDPLTGLFNRRYMLETCRREFSRAGRAGQPVSVLSIDVDHFKKYNDNHGHDAGDMVLRAVGECMENTFRNEDVPCRFGGEEFIVLLPGASIEVAARRAEQLRSKVESLIVRYLEKNLPRVTISIGVAAFPDAGDNPELILKAADEALYRAKAGGRNRVELPAPIADLMPPRKPASAALRRSAGGPTGEAGRGRQDAEAVLVMAADD